MIEELLPSGVTSSEAFDDAAPAPLFPAEAALMAGRRERRRLQFATARACARQALAGLGVGPVAVLPGPGGAPRWPSGVVGSITHCEGYRAAVVAPERVVAAVGIDAEPAGPLPSGVLGLIASPAERAALAALAAADASVPWERVFFSAKEAAYKAWYPATGIWLGFRDAELVLSPAGAFTAVLRPPVPSPVDPVYEGRWLVGRGLVVTAVTRGVPAVLPAARAVAFGSGRV
ncbi:4'-phosphopantetheinyl transferase family protein [Streptomyces avidinii]|uniref:4'-phosphopantetheinyl transferase EntD n=1 Tax=Streptomyces avidinii TaxID=1895 RepID=A0ABS4KWG8_STRAV|nr:4'-phosphopantetheinyl transferase superfamily protein [Streptomyces avidinii]MBP2034343.1 4'-phosphopantetheinyl transferase EntD [Streptomyces avidinii]GGZ37400.1 4'-phosphopantetheinyl transferase [Streptomyces avidinii]